MRHLGADCHMNVHLKVLPKRVQRGVHRCCGHRDDPSLRVHGDPEIGPGMDHHGCNARAAHTLRSRAPARSRPSPKSESRQGYHGCNVRAHMLRSPAPTRSQPCTSAARIGANCCGRAHCATESFAARKSWKLQVCAICDLVAGRLTKRKPGEATAIFA